MIEGTFNVAGLVKYCNEGLISDKGFDPKTQHYNEWFIKQFNFLHDDSLGQQLGETYYQTRFTYQLMNALNLPPAKHSGIVKFQVFQYVSICEALLDHTIDRFFGEEIGEHFAAPEFKPVSALSKNAKLIYEAEEIVCCKKTIKPRSLRDLRCDAKVSFAVDKGIISKTLGDRYAKLYSQRNNIHVLKAAKEQYHPSVEQGKEAFEVLYHLINELESFYSDKDGLIDASGEAQ